MLALVYGPAGVGEVLTLNRQARLGFRSVRNSQRSRRRLRQDAAGWGRSERAHG
jgi:hypothetical protein